MHFRFALGLVTCCVLLAQQTESPNFHELARRAADARDSNDSVQAIDLYKQALTANPKWQEGWWFLGTLLYDADRFTEARDALTHLVDLQPNAAPALQILGLCEFETGDYQQALTHLEKGIAGTPPTPQMEAVVRFHEAMLLTRTAQFDKALNAYVWFVHKGIQNPELTIALGLAALRTASFPKDITSDQRDLFGKAGKAAYLSMSGDSHSASVLLTELVKQYPDAHQVHYLYGCSLLAGDPTAAMDQLRQELKITPESAAADTMLAWILLQQGDLAAAFPYAQAAAEHDPTESMPQYVFGRALLEQGEVSKAIAHLQTAENIDTSNLDTHVLLATAYSRAGHPAEARRERLQSLSLWEGKSGVGNP